MSEYPSVHSTSDLLTLRFHSAFFGCYLLSCSFTTVDKQAKFSLFYSIFSSFGTLANTKYLHAKGNLIPFACNNLILGNKLEL